jgi:hypothetical protein
LVDTVGRRGISSPAVLGFEEVRVRSGTSLQK